MIRSSLSYIVVSSSRQRDYAEEDEGEEEEEEEEELDLRLRKLSIEEEEEEEEERSFDLSQGEESTGQLNRQESRTESESSGRSANSLSPGTDQVRFFFINRRQKGTWSLVL